MSAMETQQRKLKLSQWLNQISIPIYLLVIVFATSSWMDINGIFVELPLFVHELPEGWSLPSYLIFIIQMANIAPLCFVIAVKLWPRKVKEWPFVILIISAGATACLSLVFFWKTTAMIGDKEHSVGLLSLCLLLAITDCTSSVVYLPYMAQFKEQYLTAYYIGAGLSGLIPGLVGLVQGMGGNSDCVNKTVVLFNETTGANYTDWIVEDEFEEPLLSVEVFFFFLFGMMLVSGAAFLTLHLAPFSKREQLQKKDYKTKTSQKYILNHDYDEKPDLGSIHGANNTNEKELKQAREETASDVMDEDSVCSKEDIVVTQTTMGRCDFILLLILTGWLNAITNGILPSIQSYAALPYGNMAYNLLIRLSAIGNPLAAFLALFYSTKSSRAEVTMVLVGSILAGYQFVLALYSPNPPLQKSAVGSILVVSSGVISVMLLIYSKVTIAAMLKSSRGRLGLLWCGAITQTGSLIGAVLTFVLVNNVKIFKSIPQCA